MKKLIDNVLLKLGLIKRLEVSLPISKEEFQTRFGSMLEKEARGFMGKWNELLSKPKTKYKGEIDDSFFYLRLSHQRTKSFRKKSLPKAYALCDFHEKDTNVICKLEILGLDTPNKKSLYWFISGPIGVIVLCLLSGLPLILLLIVLLPLIGGFVLISLMVKEEIDKLITNLLDDLENMILAADQNKIVITTSDPPHRSLDTDLHQIQK